MNVDLRTLRPNPTRNLRIDPIDPERVDLLRQSIRDYGFWSGVVCRELDDGTIEIGAGHTRVQAAILEGITRADVCIAKDVDDDAMVRIYSIENATQRSNMGTARVGSVASAIRQLAIKEAEADVEISTSRKGTRGIGWREIAEYLKDINGINDGTVQQDLASLKQSGEYARIVAEVGEMMAERAEEARLAEEEARLAAEKDAEDRRKAKAADDARAAKARAEKAAMKATENTSKAKAEVANGPTFDMAGVYEHFKNPAQLDVFRKLVTEPHIAAILPVEKQATLAKHLVEEFQEQSMVNPRVEFTGTFIRENIGSLALKARGSVRRATEAEKERFMKDDMVRRAKEAMSNFSGACRRLRTEGDKISKLYEEFPDDLRFPVTQEFIEAVKDIKMIINSLSKRI